VAKFDFHVVVAVVWIFLCTMARSSYTLLWIFKTEQSGFESLSYLAV